MNYSTKKQQSFYALIFVGLLLLITTPALSVTPTEVAKLLASDGFNDDQYGYGVDIDNDTAIVGSLRDRQGASNDRTGSAYIYVRNDANVNCIETGTMDPWCQQAKLVAGDAGHNDRFGIGVTIDGDTAVVGSRQDDDGGSNTGSAYVFVRTGTTWNQQAKINPDDPTIFDRFGTFVALEGDTLVVGTVPSEQDGVSKGSAYIFTRSGAIWTQEAKLTAADGEVGDGLGQIVDISGDAVILSASGDDDMGDHAGAAYIFVRNTAALSCPETLTVDPWCEQAKLTASDGTAGDTLGGRVSLSSNTAVVGAPFGSGVVAGSGAAYIFTRSGTTWTEQAKLFASDGNAGDNFGFGTALSGDTAVIAADGDSDLFILAGSAYVFTRSGGTWSEQTPKLFASDGLSYEFFGWNVAISGDTVIAGAPRPFLPSFRGPGSAYIFDINSDETPTGNDVVVAPSPVDENGEPVEDAPEISLTFDTVSGEGETTVTITDDGPPPPGGFGVIGETGSTYIEIETTATFDGLVEVCIDYSLFELAVPAASLAFAHFVDGEWVDITSSNDLVNMILCGLTSSFSFFAIFAVEDPLAVLDGLDAAVAALDAKKGTIKSLQSKLKTARKKLTDGNPNTDVAAASVLMNAFVNNVEARRGKDISDADADALIASAITIATFVNP